MNKKENASISMIKIILISIILILVSSIGVLAVNEDLNDVTIILQNGYEMSAFTSKATVSEILSENNIILTENQKTIPELDTQISAGDMIKIVDKSYNEVQIAKISEEGTQASLDQLLENYAPITEKIVVEQVVIPFETITKNTASGSNTTNSVLQQGQDGLKEITYKIKYQNEVEIQKETISEIVVKEPVDKIVEVQVVTSRAGYSGATTYSAQVYQQYAQEYMLATYGWGDDQFEALIWLWNKESNWNPNAHNSSSGAHGIAQALPASKMASAGADYYTNGETQIRWGLSYIASRYGSPINAWNHSVAKNWY